MSGHRAAHVLVASAIVLVAGAGHAAAAATPADRPAVIPSRPTAALSWVGQVVAPVVARTDSDPSAKRVTILRPEAPLGGGITTVLITDRRPGADGRIWARVRLPVRPNGTQGWIPLDVLRLRTTTLRLKVDLSDRTLTLYRAGRVARRVVVAVGAPQWPTPTGRFAVAELIRTRTPGAFIGPVVLPLTGFSEQLNDYAGGNGRVAIHGTAVPHLLGTRASHGCVRVHNRDIIALARLVRPGTPVDIVP